MSELTISSDLARSFPTIVAGLAKAQGIFESIHSFEDIERTFLKGAGLSPNTYRAYLAAVKQLYEFTKGKHPLQITPGDIEAFYDDLAKRVDRNTAALRTAGLKRFFRGMQAVVPIYTSPFDLMAEKLQAKLSRTKKGNRTKKALTAAELRALLAWLEQDTTTEGLENHAIVYMLSTSGLRASELCQLRWGDLDLSEGTWTARFTGKGGADAEQELYTPAVEACRRYFIFVKRRNPEPADALFWTLPVVPGEQPAPVRYHVLWRRVHLVGERARAAGILKRELQFSPHLFRRSYASALYKSGMGLKAIQEKTRHASLEVLTRHYIDDSEPASGYLTKILQEVTA
jgi:integrase/recombinase XerD